MHNIAPPDLARAPGRWLCRRYIAWPTTALPSGLDPAHLDWTLHWSPTGGIDVWAPEPHRWESVALRVNTDPLPAEAATRPGIAQAVVLRVPPDLDLPAILRSQVVLTAHQASGRLVNAGGLQLAGVLDDVYAAAVDARLGVTFADGVPTLRVWAPTARSVELLLWAPGDPVESPSPTWAMTREPDGCWSITGEASWVGRRYLYSVEVFVPEFGRVVTNRVTDPYSVALTQNSIFSVIADLDADPALVPPLWRDAPQPWLESPVDQVIYELHVRDFSRADSSLPDDLRGTYLAFAAPGRGAAHLRRLAEAGLNTVQMLPIFDFATIEEDREHHLPLDKDRLRGFAPDSEEQQHYLADPSLRRAYNWGYDPWHYMVPEGGYATVGGVGGAGRTWEVREMIGALHELGLRVVLDQVYNHTTAAGQTSNSVLGRLVPGYYHRRDDQGTVYTSTCCPNVATEHAMAEKLMVDSCVWWATRYKVDGFRFDLMGHHSRANMLAVRAALDALTPERDGVDGRQITMYGEGWIFGEVAHNALFVQAAQGELAGTHIATFSDRLRDAVRGGRPFDVDPRLQGFGTGLWTAPNACPENGTPAQQRDRLLQEADLIQLGLAGTLRDFSFVSQRTGRRTLGEDLDYRGRRAGYAAHPDEVVNYVDAHDNETLFDALTLKLPVATPMAQRVRANTLCLALPTLGQSAVMWHAGTDFLRSKSLDRNSYDSGDWFNYLDFSMRDNGFGAGLPPAADNADRWPYLRPLLALRELKPSPDAMRRAHEQALDLLRLRASSRLFRLGDPELIKTKVSFPVSGTWTQVPGVILMLLDDTAGEPVDPAWRRIAVVFNGTAWPVRQQTPRLFADWRLHPVQQAGADEVVRAARVDDGVFMVPGLTAAVFVEPR